MNKNRPRQISLAALVYAVDIETAEMSWYTLRPQDTVNTILCLPPESVIQVLNIILRSVPGNRRSTLGDLELLRAKLNKLNNPNTSPKIINLWVRSMP